MYETQIKEQFSRAYVGSIASRLGINTSKPDVDDDSVDLTLIGKGYEGHCFHNPNVDIQLKCSSSLKIRNGLIQFSIKKKNYNDLRKDHCIHPRYLFVLMVPKKINEWITINTDHMAVKNICFYLSIKGMAESKNKGKVQIHIPLENKVSCEILSQIMEKAADGESI